MSDLFYYIDCGCGYKDKTDREIRECPKCGNFLSIRGYQIIPTLKCECGNEVSLYSHTNECECGRLYNAFGQQLRPMNEWQEDW